MSIRFQVPLKKITVSSDLFALWNEFEDMTVHFEAWRKLSLIQLDEESEKECMAKLRMTCIEVRMKKNEIAVQFSDRCTLDKNEILYMIPLSVINLAYMETMCMTCSAVFGNEMWPAAEYGRTMYTVRQRIGTLAIKMEKRYGLSYPELWIMSWDLSDDCLAYAGTTYSDFASSLIVSWNWSWCVVGVREDRGVSAEVLSAERNAGSIGEGIREIQVRAFPCFSYCTSWINEGQQQRTLQLLTSEEELLGARFRIICARWSWRNRGKRNLLRVLSSISNFICPFHAIFVCISKVCFFLSLWSED